MHTKRARNHVHYLHKNTQNLIEGTVIAQSSAIDYSVELKNHLTLLKQEINNSELKLIKPYLASLPGSMLAIEIETST